MTEPYIALKGNRAAIMKRYRHPWVFSRGLAARPRLEPGSLVRVTGADKEHLGWAFYNPNNAIALRMVSFEEPRPDPAFWAARIEQALAMRRALFGEGRRAYRLIHGDHDGFPGLTADVYGDLIVVQVSGVGMERLKRELAPVLVEITGASAVFERSEGGPREQDGLKPAKGFLHGIHEFPFTLELHGYRWDIHPAEGQKTGLFLDQIDNHRWIEERAAGKDVLDLCCYSGGFTLAALRGNAAFVRSLDVSPRAIAALAVSLAHNGLAGERHESVQADVFAWSSKAPDRRFDLVILDPPAMAKSVKNAKSALKAYSKLQTAAAKWVKPGGTLLTFSCSGVVTLADFQQSVFLGLRMADREPMLISRFGPGPDHPVNLRFPEGEYLKGLALYLP